MCQKNGDIWCYRHENCKSNVRLFSSLLKLHWPTFQNSFCTIDHSARSRQKPFKTIFSSAEFYRWHVVDAYPIDRYRTFNYSYRWIIVIYNKKCLFVISFLLDENGWVHDAKKLTTGLSYSLQLINCSIISHVSISLFMKRDAHVFQKHCCHFETKQATNRNEPMDCVTTLIRLLMRHNKSLLRAPLSLSGSGADPAP